MDRDRGGKKEKQQDRQGDRQVEREKDVGWDGQTGITRERHRDRDREGRKEKQQDKVSK